MARTRTRDELAGLQAPGIANAPPLSELPEVRRRDQRRSSLRAAALLACLLAVPAGAWAAEGATESYSLCFCGKLAAIHYAGGRATSQLAEGCWEFLPFQRGLSELCGLTVNHRVACSECCPPKLPPFRLQSDVLSRSELLGVAGDDVAVALQNSFFGRMHHCLWDSTGNRWDCEPYNVLLTCQPYWLDASFSLGPPSVGNFENPPPTCCPPTSSGGDRPPPRDPPGPCESGPQKDGFIMLMFQ
jgi:hypothetical protein